MADLAISGGFDDRISGFLGHQRKQETSKIRFRWGTRNKNLLKALYGSGTIFYPEDSEMSYWDDKQEKNHFIRAMKGVNWGWWNKWEKILICP